MSLKRFGLIAAAAFLLLALFIPGPARAESGLEIRDSSAQPEFPQRLSFHLSAESDTDITDIRLHYRVDRIGFADVTSEIYLDFEPSPSVAIDWSLEMVMVGGLPPGSSVEYWWTVRDAAGGEAATAPVAVLFDDNRFSWQELTEGRVTLYWYSGDQSFADELMAAVQQALVRLHEYAGVEIERPVKLYIYASAQDLQGSMIFPREWTGGVAFTRYGIMAIGIAADNLEWGKRAIAHELTHLIVHQVTLNPYGDLPTWLDEGLALHSEGELLAAFVTSLNQAISNDSLISVQSLASPFSVYVNEASLSYAESYSIVEYLNESYGQDKMFELLSTFRAGSTYDGALEAVYGFDMDGLDERWRDWLIPPAASVMERSGELSLAAAEY